MKLSLIGMSNTGKSYWSKKLEQAGFKRYCCDDLIEAKISPILNKLGYQGIGDMSKWMGQPYDKQYQENAGRYLELEKMVLQEVFDEIELMQERIASDYAGNIVIDTTGSVIYTGDSIISKLRQFTRIVYLETPEQVKSEIYSLFIKEPKPVIWGDLFNQEPDEDNIEALKRNYLPLLQYRTRQYEKLADKTLDYFDLHSTGFNFDRFMNLII